MSTENSLFFLTKLSYIYFTLNMWIANTKTENLLNVWCTCTQKLCAHHCFGHVLVPIFIGNASVCVLIIFVYVTFIVIADNVSLLSKLVCKYPGSLMNEKLLIFRIILLWWNCCKIIPLMQQQCRTVNNKFICSAGLRQKSETIK